MLNIYNNLNLMYIENNFIVIFSKKGIFKFKIIDLCYFLFINYKYQVNITHLLINLSFDKLKKYINLIKSIFFTIYNGINFGYTNYLFFKGIGYKMFNWFNFVFFKLGYSHFFYFVIPLEISIFFKKKKKVIKFYLLQNWKYSYIINKINSFRLYNLYTKKGIFKKLQYLFFKEGKKKQL